MARSKAMLHRVVATLSVAALLALAALTLAPPAFAQTSGFPDVDPSLPAYEAIGFLSSANIISGYQDGTFGPSDTLKRGQATKMLVLWQELAIATTARPRSPTRRRLPRLRGDRLSPRAGLPGTPTAASSLLDPQPPADGHHHRTGHGLGEHGRLELSAEDVDDTLAGIRRPGRRSPLSPARTSPWPLERPFGGDAKGRLKPKDGITRAQFCLVVFRAEVSIPLGHRRSAQLHRVARPDPGRARPQPCARRSHRSPPRRTASSLSTTPAASSASR